MADFKWGGGAQLVSCGANTVTGYGIKTGVKARIEKTKPKGDRPTIPNLNGFGLKAKTAKAIKDRARKARAKWDKKFKAWKAAQKAAVAKAEKAAKKLAQKLAEEHMAETMKTKKCLDPKCRVLVPDKAQKANKGSLLARTVLTDTFVYASAYSKWTSAPVCKAKEEEEEKEKQ